MTSIAAQIETFAPQVFTAAPDSTAAPRHRRPLIAGVSTIALLLVAGGVAGARVVTPSAAIGPAMGFFGAASIGRTVEPPQVAPEPEKVDPVRAIEASCDAGDLTACVQFAKRLHAGDGIDKNEDRSIEVYEKACDAGSPEGCYGAGSAIVASGPSSTNRPRAVRLLRKACVARIRDSCTKLSDLEGVHDSKTSTITTATASRVFKPTSTSTPQAFSPSLSDGPWNQAKK